MNHGTTEVEERIAALEEENKELRSELGEVKTELRGFREYVEDELEDLATEFSEYKDHNERDKAKIRNRVSQNEEEKSDDGRVDKLFDTIRTQVESITTTDAYEDYEGVPEPDLSYIERLYHIGREAVDDMPRARDLYAKVLLTAWPDWGWKDNNGNVILPTTDNLRGKMNRKVENGFEYSQLYRACEALADRSDGKIEYVKDHSKIGRHLKVRAENVDEIAVNFQGMSGPPGTKEGRRRTLAAR